MSVKSVLKNCHDTLIMSSDWHRVRNDIDHAEMCSLQADAVLKLLADLNIEQQEETSDGPRICHHCRRTIDVGNPIFWNRDKPYCSHDCRGDFGYYDAPVPKETSDGPA